MVDFLNLFYCFGEGAEGQQFVLFFRRSPWPDTTRMSRVHPAVSPLLVGHVYTRPIWQLAGHAHIAAAAAAAAAGLSEDVNDGLKWQRRASSAI